VRLAHLAAAAAAALVGCQLISGASQDTFTGGGGATATGSGTSVSSSSNASSSSTGTGGSGGCAKPADCPGIDTDCIQRTCTSGKCGMGNSAKDTPCAEDGGKFCDGGGTCVECNNDTQCAIDQYCSSMTHQCRNKDCTDGKINGTETDLDCGGTKCDGCALGKGCLVGGDCKSGFCKGAGGSGSGGAGGGGPQTKGACSACIDDADCVAVANTFCSQGTCTPKKKPGAACSDKLQCASGFCVDGVCCNAACTSACQSCVAKDTGNADGTCAAVTKNTDPAAECALKPMSTCGAKGLGCNGDNLNPQCVSWDAGTSCSTPSCKDAENTGGAGTCDGNGSCVPGMSTSCVPYKCMNGSCLKACGGDGDCAAGHYCDSTVCTKKKAKGAGCGAGNQCDSGFCVDGVCCDNACNGACAACSVAAGSAVDGTCGAIKNKADPGLCDAVTGCAGLPCTCNSAGTCKSANGATCAVAMDCASGFCPAKDKVCCDGACNGKCQGCKMADFTGQPDGTCEFVMNGQDPFLDCAMGKKCNGAGVCQ
jgi:hypothetical protein